MGTAWSTGHSAKVARASTEPTPNSTVARFGLPAKSTVLHTLRNESRLGPAGGTWT